MGHPKPTSDPFGPLRHAVFARQMVLADLQFDIVHAGREGVSWHCVVSAVHLVGFVVADTEVRHLPHRFEHRQSETIVTTVVQHAGIPRPVDAIHAWRETVQRDQYGRPVRLSSSRDFCRDRTLVGLVNGGDPRGAIRLGQSQVSGDCRAVADFGNGVRPGRVAVAVDNKPRPDLGYENRIQSRREVCPQAGHADIPRNVTSPVPFAQAEVTQPIGDQTSGMVADQQERRGPGRVYNRHRSQPPRAEKPAAHSVPFAVMPILTLSHLTVYRYRQSVAFGEHRIMVRPRESYDQRLIEATLDIDPLPFDLRWVQDVFGNAVALARFDRHATDLRFDSSVRMDHAPVDPERVDIEDYARDYPFTYSSQDMPDLLRSIERQHRDPDRIVDRWARQFLEHEGRTATLGLLTEMTRTIRRELTYVPRHEQGTQTPLETLRVRQGTCRDYAVLMIEAVRSLGFAARFVSGYVYSPSHHEDRIGGGNTHAWVRIFIPGSGWVEFGPTNGIIGNRGLIRVAIARDPCQALPLSGGWTGFPGSALGMDVAVRITTDPEPPEASMISHPSAPKMSPRNCY